MQVVLFDSPQARQSLYPFTAVRTIADIRMGLYTARERWQQVFPLAMIHILSESYLNFDIIETTEPVLYINSSMIFSHELSRELLQLQPGRGIKQDSNIIAFKTDVVKNYGFAEADCSEVHFEKLTTTV
ncbi:MAG: hypothetical protein KGZ74_16715, partial [Chitinophagaceae bacterium]|nr:hypothetical protein [Chitinophagaceae bacterium]